MDVKCDVCIFHRVHHTLSHLSDLLYPANLWRLQRKTVVPLTLDHRYFSVSVGIPRWLLLINALVWREA